MNDADNSLEERAGLLFDLQRYQEAVPLLLRALEMEPDNPRLHCRLAYAYWQADKNREAHRSLDCAMIADPNYEWSFRLRSCLFVYEGRGSEAVSQALIAVNLDPESAYAHDTLADAYLATKEYSLALAAAERVLELAPDRAYAYNGMAEVHLAMEHWTRATDNAKQALTLDAENVEARLLLGKALEEQGLKADAMHCYTDAAKLSPADSEPIRHMRNAAFDYVFNIAFLAIALAAGFGFLFHKFGFNGWLAALLGYSLAVASIGAIMRFVPIVVVYVYSSYHQMPAPAKQTVLRTVREDWLINMGIVALVIPVLVVALIVIAIIGMIII
jgi:tetratricopeptide (TPR) repeat protein